MHAEYIRAQDINHFCMPMDFQKGGGGGGGLMHLTMVKSQTIRHGFQKGVCVWGGGGVVDAPHDGEVTDNEGPGSRLNIFQITTFNLSVTN